jgi:CheY-specific phosphatase CheX
MQVHLEEESVVKASSQFWEQMLSMKLEQLSFEDRFSVHDGHVMGSVELCGAWVGRIEIRMSTGLAQQATAAMLMQTTDSVGVADTLDATKEIANMIAGTIKSALPRPCTMTVPQSCIHAEEFSGVSRSEDSMVVAFRHQSGELMVRVVECALCPVL